MREKGTTRVHYLFLSNSWFVTTTVRISGFHLIVVIEPIIFNVQAHTQTHTDTYTRSQLFAIVQVDELFRSYRGSMMFEQQLTLTFFLFFFGFVSLFKSAKYPLTKTD